ncbi:MAG: aspartate kinase, partial [Acidobacteriota bacterium]|nr:aspartate kinase [Acidobacteriota bacterium]
MTDARPVVIKLGGSVLSSPKSYARAARWVRSRVIGPPLLIIVSAEQGHTDRLLAEAEAIAARPDPRALDLLWATGELRSAALLALHLQAIGIPSRALNVHEAGVTRTSDEVTVRTREIASSLRTHAAVIVPGFL